MLGKEIFDPEGLERAGSEVALGLLPVRTIMERDKVTVPARGMARRCTLFGQKIDQHEFCGYEIHLGTTEYLDGAEPFASIARQGDAARTVPDGCVSAEGAYSAAICTDSSTMTPSVTSFCVARAPRFR